jgi:hypothetical protein
MEALKTAKGSTFAAIAYHISDTFVDEVDAANTRYQYYRPGSVAVPLSIIDGGTQFLGGIPGGNLYSNFLSPYNAAAALIPPVDISLSMEGPDRVLVKVTNTSSSVVHGTLHVALVERFRPFPWRDLSTVDFVCRTMWGGPNGQQINLSPSQNYESVDQFSFQADWNYLSIVAFLQTDDKKIVQGALLDVEDSIPALQLQGVPETGNLWLKGSTHTFSWSSNRPLNSVVIEYSRDGGSTWNEIQPQNMGGKSYRWTVPDVSATRCLLAVRDPYGGARTISGLFAIGIKGDFNADGTVNAADRSILVDHLTENKTALLPGADLNGDGMVDLFDLLYFDSTF